MPNQHMISIILHKSEIMLPVLEQIQVEPFSYLNALSQSSFINHVAHHHDISSESCTSFHGPHKMTRRDTVGLKFDTCDCRFGPCEEKVSLSLLLKNEDGSCVHIYMQ